jgi:hypothetical protein
MFAEAKGLRTRIDPHKADLPEEYATPSELMRGLYKLEGRELPEEALSQAGGGGETQKKEPAAQAETETAQEGGEPLGQKREETPSVPEPLQFVPADQKRTDEAAQENAQTEERIWTVGEIVGARRREMEAAAEIMSDVDLDILLDEIMDEE